MECIVAAVVILGILFLLAAVSGPGTCSVCHAPIKKKYYVWKTNGEKLRLCPKCNRQMERNVSRDAFKSKYG
ncbi:MAG: hypothetical protein EHJ95_08250 [Methanobacteriota archaeon]|nr:MAG: hypothetical protein EHJ95_08250 [Euryarchaeota archaeon]